MDHKRINALFFVFVCTYLFASDHIDPPPKSYMDRTTYETNRDHIIESIPARFRPDVVFRDAGFSTHPREQVEEVRLVYALRELNTQFDRISDTLISASHRGAFDDLLSHETTLTNFQSQLPARTITSALDIADDEARHTRIRELTHRVIRRAQIVDASLNETAPYSVYTYGQRPLVRISSEAPTCWDYVWWALCRCRWRCGR